jgi:aminopeptidase N
MTARFLLAIALLAGCPSTADDAPQPGENWARDILSVDLTLDLDERTGSATIAIASDTATTASLDVSGLDVQSVSFNVMDDVSFLYEIDDGRLDMGFTAGIEGSVTIEYTFDTTTGYDGFRETGSTILWPYYCGNFYPCDPDPTDDFTLTMDVTSTAQVVFPGGPISGVPAYQPAVAMGTYTHTVLGTTPGGVDVELWTTTASATSGVEGTADLVEVMAWLETTLGAYPFGDRVGVVAVDWGLGAYGGLENHPFWHVSEIAMGDASVHAHEAAHGWFGNGVRLACWEDFVLSEGLATYLAARAITVVVGDDDGMGVWADYQAELTRLLASDDRIVLPDDTCGEIDVLEDLWSRIVYMKGAFFLRAVADVVGAEELDAALGVFTRARIGTTARMQDLLDTIQAETGFDPGPLAQDWLRTEGAP